MLREFGQSLYIAEGPTVSISWVEPAQAYFRTTEERAMSEKMQSIHEFDLEMICKYYGYAFFIGKKL